ncbi:MAG: GNAT family N-acetyltransferase [Beggiatoa sp.]|nr:GNAT family N-acetyltransferase [Beggiatoa sp.]
MPVDQTTVERRKVVWHDILAAPASDGFALIAEGESRVVGFCHLTTPSRDRDGNAGPVELTSFYVPPEHWRRGIGAALLGRAIDELVATGWPELTLWVLAANDPARAFYSAFGFEPDGAEKTHERTGQWQVRLRRLVG